jgi:hypothetical protein
MSTQNKNMAITETLTSNELTLSAPEALLALDGNYDTYWQQFGELYGGDIQVTAETNQARQTALTTRLHNPSKSTGNRFVDSLSPADVAEEWYMGIGSLNKLRGSSASMLLAAATLWESPQVAELPDPKLATRFITEVGTIRRGQVPERMERALADPTHLQHMSLAGQATLDIARIPEDEHINERIFAADLSLQINQGLFKLLLEKPELSSEQKRVLSDSLKAEYDAKFELITLKRSNGELSDSDYEVNYNQVLVEQVQDTLRASSNMTNGDLHEHYFVALMRYALNTWQEQSGYTVMSATRRQDEPYDRFAPKHLPKFSYDVIVAEPSRNELTLIQLKTSQDPESMPYANGIMVLDNILTPYASNTELRNELMTGLTQMRGLLREVTTGERYTGSDQIIHRHVDRILQSFEP